MLESILKEAIELQKNGHLDEAKLKYKEILASDKKNFNAYYFLSWIAFDEKNYKTGLELIKKAINLNSKVSGAYTVLGLFNKELENYDEAIKNFNIATDLDKNNFKNYINLGSAFAAKNQYEEALDNFKKSININKDNFAAYNNIGFCLLQLHRYTEALQYLDKAIQLKSDFDPAHFNKAKLYNIIYKKDAAFLEFNLAISFNNKEPEYYVERGGFMHKSRGETLAALKDLQYAYSLKKDYKLLLGNILYILANIIDFKEKSLILKQCLIDISSDLNTIHPHIFLLVNDDVNLQFKITKNFVKANYLKNYKQENFFFSKKIVYKKIKVGYFSSDLGNHPVSRQIVELLELHDRNCFEIYLFSLRDEPECPLKQRLLKSCDHFILIDKQIFQETIKLVRDLNIDIALDLNGYTDGARTEIFRNRIAPIQINYLGYAGTMAANFMDYIIADKIVIPEEAKNKYSEKIIYLPNTFMVNDRKKAISEKKINKADFGLPEKNFIFCSFNSVYKITEEIFNHWVEILKQVDNSILWLGQAKTVVARDNIINECKKREFSPNRIIFADSVDHSTHLARHKLADLFLDTFPYNAHSTACEALWAGVPIVSLVGKSFHSRVVASLLKAIDIPELSVETIEDYKKLAIELALNPQKLKKIKYKIQLNRNTTPLFDTFQYVENLEKAYKKIYERYQSDQKPDHIYINE